MLKQRLIFGSLMVALVVGLFWLDSRLDATALSGPLQRLFAGRPSPPAGLLLALVAVVLIPLAARELVAIFRANNIESGSILISIAAIASAMTVYSTPMSLTAPTGAMIIASVLVACFLITLLWHSRGAHIQGVVAAAGATMFAVAYLGLMSGFFLAMRRWHSAWVVLAVILITKSADTGAYFTGRAIGRHKLIPWLSPGKTWEGLIGGIVLAALVAAAFAWVSQVTDLATSYRTAGDQIVAVRREYHMGLAAVAGALFALVGAAGDLTMSLFKRDAGLKDSGRLIPGMGGVLDVLDSPLLVAPFAYWLLELAANE